MKKQYKHCSQEFEKTSSNNNKRLIIKILSKRVEVCLKRKKNI